MIDALVFSKDRAAQLDLLLRTTAVYGSLLFDTITVQWTASTVELAEGYAICEGEHAGVRFELEHPDGFERTFRRWLDRGAPDAPIMFLVDDDVWYRPAPIPRGLDRQPFSYRGGDYWYPFSLDGSVFQRCWVRDVLHGQGFRDPNELENEGWLHRDRLPFASVTPCEPPCLVGVPANRVSGSSGLPHSGMDPVALNDRYMRGHRFPMPRLEGRRLGAHAFIGPEVYA